MATAPEEEWNKLLLDGMTVGKGDVSPEDLYAVIKKRIERTLIRTVSPFLDFACHILMSLIFFSLL